MHTFGKRCGALALACSLLCPPVGGLLASAQAQTPTAIRIPTSPVQAGPIHSILLFPFANAIPASGGTGGFNAEVVGARVEDAVKLRLNVIGRYKANSFSPNLPQVQRALQEARVEGLSENDLTPPYDDPQKGQKIATQIGTDGYLLGSVQSLRVDPATRNVSVTVSATLYSTATAGAAKVLAYTGKGVSFNAGDDQDSLLQSAINDAAGHIVSALNASAQNAGAGQQPQRTVLPSSDYQRGRRSNNGSILLGILLAAAVGVAVSSSHHGGGGSTSSTGTGTGTTTGTGTGSSSPPAAPSL